MKERKKRNFKCLYCTFNSTDVEEVKAHEEYLHGCYRDINPRNPRGKPSKFKVRRESPEGDIVQVGDTICKWDGYKYVDVKPTFKGIVNEEEPDVIEWGDGSTKYKCKNCGHYTKLLTNPYEYFSLPLNKKVRIPDDAIPLILCPICGLNIFKDNRLAVKTWLAKKVDRKLPDEINKDVVMSVETDLGIIKKEKKANEIL